MKTFKNYMYHFLLLFIYRYANFAFNDFVYTLSICYYLVINSL